MLRNEYLLDYMNLMNYVTNGVNNRFSIFYLSSWRIQIGTTKVYIHTFNKKEPKITPAQKLTPTTHTDDMF